MLVDITERKQAAEREVEHLRHAEQAAQRLASIVELSDDAIVSKDLDGIITTWNRGAERLFGYTADEVIGKSVTMLIPDGSPRRGAGNPERIRAGERIEHYETIRQHKDGSLIDISLTVSPVRDGEGRIVGASKIARDITDAQARRAGAGQAHEGAGRALPVDRPAAPRDTRSTTSTTPRSMPSPRRSAASAPRSCCSMKPK